MIPVPELDEERELNDFHSQRSTRLQDRMQNALAIPPRGRVQCVDRNSGPTRLEVRKCFVNGYSAQSGDNETTHRLGLGGERFSLATAEQSSMRVDIAFLVCFGSSSYRNRDDKSL